MTSRYYLPLIVEGVFWVFLPLNNVVDYVHYWPFPLDMKRQLPVLEMNA